MGKRYYIATPCYSPPVPDYTVSMLATQKALVEAGHQFDLGYVQGLCYVHVARNWLVKGFLASKCDEMIFIDSDLGWDAGDLLRLAALEVNVVGGAAPYRTNELGFPVALKNDKDGVLLGHPFNDGSDAALLEADVVPSAMLKITRGVFEEIIKRGEAHWRIETEGGTDIEKKRWRSFFDFETTPYPKNGKNDEFCEYGEDVSFCRKCQRAGFSLWVDPRMTLRHWGMHGFQGQLHKWLQGSEDVAKRV